MSQVAKVFEVKWQGFNLRRGVILLVILGLLIIVGVLPGERKYFLSAIFGALLVALVDPGGEYGYRVSRLAVFAVAGALLTALGFGIGPDAWGWVVLAAFVATLLGGLAVKYGLHRFVVAYLLNVWFIIALGPLPGCAGGRGAGFGPPVLPAAVRLHVLRDGTELRGELHPAADPRTDALYFTVTVFSTVGFGDITAKSETARIVLIVQMLADLAFLGAGVRVLLGAVQRRRERRPKTCSRTGKTSRAASARS